MNQQRLALVGTALAAVAIVALSLLVTQRYFNSRELQSLVEQANEQGVGYEVVLDNPWTGRYSFLPSR